MPRTMFPSVSDQVLDQAMHLFWEQGYFDTSIDEIVAQTGLSRAAIYAAFGSKEQLFSAMLTRFRRMHTDSMLSPLQAKDAGLPELHVFLLRVRSALSRRESRLGCLLCATSADPSAHMPMVAPIIRTFISDLRCLITRALRHAQASGQIQYDGPVEPLAAGLTASVIGLMTLARSPTSRRTVVCAVDGVLQYLDALTESTSARLPSATSSVARPTRVASE